MIDLSEASGLPISVGDDFKINFSPPLNPVQPSARTLRQMKTVLMDANANCGREETYLMYRDIHLPDDESKIRDSKVRYDITVIPPCMLGQEYNKTLGHYHPNKPGTPFAYPEVYQILHGKALILLQKIDDSGNLTSVYTMEAAAKDRIVYPPNYAHILVNIGSDALVTANWVSDDFESKYEPIEEKRGMAYYVVKGEGGYNLIPNPNYARHPKANILTDRNMAIFPIMHHKQLYNGGIYDLTNLEFLNYPEKYAVELSTICS
jgi:glucose-6-phosphate isomerase